MDNLLDAQQLKNRGAEAFGKADAKAIISWYENSAGITQMSAPSGNNIASGYVNYSFLNLRISPGTNKSLVVKLSRNDPVYIYKSSSGWYQFVALHDGAYYEGYVSSSYITKDAEIRHPGTLAKVSDTLEKASQTGRKVEIAAKSLN